MSFDTFLALLSVVFEGVGLYYTWTLEDADKKKKRILTLLFVTLIAFSLFFTYDFFTTQNRVNTISIGIIDKLAKATRPLAYDEISRGIIHDGEAELFGKAMDQLVEKSKIEITLCTLTDDNQANFYNINCYSKKQ
jgi:hypothetical protein